MSHDFGRFVWFELIANDLDRAQAFYAEVVGWKTETMDMGGGHNYRLLLSGKDRVGGLVPPPKAGVPPHWVSYVSVANVDATAKKIIALGGTSLMDAFDVPSIGRMQPVTDPFGAALFLFNAENGDNEAPTGPGAFHWNELWADDPEKAVAFYENVFGYTHETMEMPEGTYFVLKSGDAMRGGVMKSPAEGMPSHWQQYITVDDCDAALVRAKSNGGKIVAEAIDVPGVGRFGHVQDPVGGVIGLIKPAERS